VVTGARRVIVLRHGRVAADVPVEKIKDARYDPWLTWTGVQPPPAEGV